MNPPAEPDSSDNDLLSRRVYWAHGYDGYERLAGDPSTLEAVLATARSEWRKSGCVPDWCGVDLLRGWAFYLTRADRQAGGYTLDLEGSAWAEWNSVMARLASHPSGRPEDRPPLPVSPSVTTGSSAPALTLSTQPRMHRDADYLVAKQARWFEPHIAPVNTLVEEIARTVGGDVPYVDPDCGGVNARVLLLLEAPAGAAAHGSRMLSADNDDGTAANVWRAYDASGMPRSWGLHWNAVPWYVGVPGKIRAATGADVVAGRPWLRRLIDLLPELRVVLTLGNRAGDAVRPERAVLEGRGITLVTAPHPSQRLYNSTKGVARVKVHEGFAEAVRIAEAP